MGDCQMESYILAFSVQVLVIDSVKDLSTLRVEMWVKDIYILAFELLEWVSFTQKEHLNKVDFTSEGENWETLRRDLQFCLEKRSGGATRRRIFRLFLELGGGTPTKKKNEKKMVITHLQI